ncbi:MAG: DUF5615 family PIN-like protein [Armatimonadetes bacterium]|nr:DUF5615 family PIN-like protein [Armatimonadota bacterium]
MRVLLDECLPRKLKREFVNCAVSTVAEMGWAGKKNGELMKAAHGHFDAFVTADQNLQYQQNLAYADVRVVVLVAINNRIETLAPLMPLVIEALQSIAAGQVVEIKAKTD